MYAQVEKPKENESRAVANSVAQMKSSVKQGFGFVDNRPETKTRETLLLSIENNREPVAQRFLGGILTALAAVAWGYDYLKTWLLSDLDGNYKFSVMYFRDGKFTDVIGHVSVALQENNGTVLGVWGLSPQNLPENPMKELGRLMSTPGKIYHDDSDLFPDHAASKETFSISGATANKVLNKILDDIAAPPNYSISGYGGASCASWAINIAKIAGVSAGGVTDRYLVGIPRIMSLYSENLSEGEQQTFKDFKSLQDTVPD